MLRSDTISPTIRITAGPFASVSASRRSHSAMASDAVPPSNLTTVKSPLSRARPRPMSVRLPRASLYRFSSASVATSTHGWPSLRPSAKKGTVNRMPPASVLYRVATCPGIATAPPPTFTVWAPAAEDAGCCMKA